MVDRRYVERAELLQQLSGRTEPAAVALADALAADSSIELVSIAPVVPADLLPTYRVRLARAEAGQGPHTLGLREWVSALESVPSARLAGVQAGAVSGLCLLDDSGSVLAVTTVEARGQTAPATASRHAEQVTLAARFGLQAMPPLAGEKVGVALNVQEGVWPINGLRHPIAGDTCGWYVWAGEHLSEDPDFFVPLHVEHLAAWVPLVVPYLGLPPGWRFLVAPGYEDVWFDEGLLTPRPGPAGKVGMAGYETIGTDAARTPRGAIVRVLGRNGVSYEGPEGPVEIDAEMLARPMAVAIYPASIRSPSLPAEDVLEDLLGALDHLGFSVQVIGTLP